MTTASIRPLADVRTGVIQTCDLLIDRKSEQFRSDPDHGTAIFIGNITLGMIAATRGETLTAIEYLDAASRSPKSDEIVYAPGQYYGQRLWYSLCRRLLAEGQSHAVLRFLERFTQLNLSERETVSDLLDDFSFFVPPA